MRKMLTLGVMAAAFMLGAPLSSQAGTHVSWSIGINVPGPVVYAPQPQVVYQAPPQVVYQQPQVIYQPQPVYRYEPPPRVVYSYPVQTVVYPRQRRWAPDEDGEHQHCEHRGGWWRHHHDRDGYERGDGRSWSREGYGRWNRWER
jgi:hypothetical protein